MNKICVFAKNKSTYFIRRLQEESSQVELFDPWSDFLFPEAQTYLVRTTGVYRNDLDLLMLDSLSGKRVVNPVSVLKRFRLKSTQYEWMEENNFPVLPWLPVKGTDLLTVEKFFRLYPSCVVKPLAGQGGWGIEALTWDNFRSWKKKKGSDEDYLLQVHVKGAEEYRYLFIKGHAPLTLRRRSNTGITANFRASGTAEPAELPSEVRSVLDSVIHASGAHYGAIDLLVEDDRASIIDFNSVPGFEQAEAVSGRNLVRELLSSIQ